MKERAIRIAKCLICIFVLYNQNIYAIPKSILCRELSNPQMEYACKELQRYMYQLSNEVLTIDSVFKESNVPTFLIGTKASYPSIAKYTHGLFSANVYEELGDEGYTLQKVNKEGHDLLIITANNPIACLYGVYGLLDDHYNVGFYMSGDVMSQQKAPFYLPEVSEVKKPSLYIRGFLPWTNFPQSATVYSWEDWKFIIDQATKMRMNFIHIHNYNGQNGHNEMFHNFTINGYTSRTWMPTAQTGHRWGCHGFEVKDFLFKGEALFDDYDFGSACTLHNESLTNEEVSKKGISLFQNVIHYAHERGVKMALGIDIDLILPEYKLEADDPLVIEARVKQITTDYPDLDYLILFVSEMINHDTKKLEQWKLIFNEMYQLIKERSPKTHIAVAGWGLSKAIANQLPKDVIAAPISSYSDQFENGDIYGDREYWGCPWLERDVYSSCYYYPYDMHLSNTIKAYKNRASNMKGLYCLTWRITDAIDPKLSYISKAPWDTENRYQSSYDVYAEYAKKNYGRQNVEPITNIINQNEPDCSKVSECQSTDSFTGDDWYKSDFLLNIKYLNLYRYEKRVSGKLAYTCDRAYGITKSILGKADSCLTEINHGDYILFKQLDFGIGTTELGVTISTQNAKVCVEFRLDDLNGRTIGSIDLIHSGGWQNWSNQICKIYETSGSHDLYVIFNTRKSYENPYEKAIRQSSLIQKCIAKEKDLGAKQRMQYLCCRIDAVRDYMDINKNFPHIQSSKELPGQFPSWVKNFIYRVNDISSLGNVQSIQNRYVQERYLQKEKELLDTAKVKFPTSLKVFGTSTGAILTWMNVDDKKNRFNIYRNSQQINKEPVQATQYTDFFNGEAMYQVETINQAGIKSELSAAVVCQAGTADHEAPCMIVVSPPTSVKIGQKATLSVRILDNREDQMITAVLFYRNLGERSWKQKRMDRKTKAIFMVDLPAQSKSAIEYYVLASDGNNKSLYPVTAPALNNTLVYESSHEITISSKSSRLNLLRNGLEWKPVDGAFIYHIYRAKAERELMKPSTRLTYVSSNCTTFQDLAPDFNGKKKQGTYYYKVVAEDIYHNQGKPSNTIRIQY